MNLYFRFVFLLLKRIFVFHRVDLFAPCATQFWVNPADLDMNLHMNNGRYLSVMDLGRIDLMLRAGVLKKFFKNGYYPVVASESIRFRKSLEPFQTFTLVTQIESWNDVDFFLTQRFMAKGKVVAEGYIRGRFKQRGRKGSVPTAEVFHIAGHGYDGPKLSPLAQAQVQVDGYLAND